MIDAKTELQNGTGTASEMIALANRTPQHAFHLVDNIMFTIELLREPEAIEKLNPMIATQLALHCGEDPELRDFRQMFLGRLDGPGLPLAASVLKLDSRDIEVMLRGLAQPGRDNEEIAATLAALTRQPTWSSSLGELLQRRLDEVDSSLKVSEMLAVLQGPNPLDGLNAEQVDALELWPEEWVMLTQRPDLSFQQQAALIRRPERLYQMLTNPVCDERILQAVLLVDHQHAGRQKAARQALARQNIPAWDEQST